MGKLMLDAEEKSDIERCIKRCKAKLNDAKATEVQKAVAQAGLDECNRIVAEFG